MITLDVILSLLFAHWGADFLAQTEWMALNKSKDGLPLAVHCLIYGTIMGIVFTLFNYKTAVFFGVANMMLHIIIDGVTSRATAWAWKRHGGSRIFFNIIGFDQFLHACCIFGTFVMFGGKSWV